MCCCCCIVGRGGGVAARDILLREMGFFGALRAVAKFGWIKSSIAYCFSPCGDDDDDFARSEQ